MKFLLDANVEYRLAISLRSSHHDVKTIVHDFPSHVADHEVLAIATKEQRILLTNDRDFGELIFRQHHPHCGVILFRFKNTKDINPKLALLHTVLHEYQEHLHDYLVLTPNGVRIRKRIEEQAA
jgi:predicted nuclease of predicted toxin-antitoxin system